MKHVQVLAFFICFQISLQAQPAFDWVKKMSPNTNVGGSNGSHILDKYGNSYNYGEFSGVIDFDPGPGVYTLTSASADMDIFITKLNPQGDFIWAKKAGSTGLDRAASVVIDDNDNIYISGTFEQTVDFDPGAGIANLTSGMSGDGFLLKLDSAGNYMYAKTFGGTGNENPSMKLDNNKNIYLYGGFQYTADFDPGAAVYNVTAAGNLMGIDAYVIKLDSNANFVWVRTFGSAGHDAFSALKVSAAGDLYLGGSFSDTVDFDPGPGTYNLTSAPYYSDLFILKLNGNGDLVWVKNFTGNFNRILCDIELDNQNNIYVNGYFQDTLDIDPGPSNYFLTAPAAASNAFIAKFDSNANLLWGKSLKGKSSYGFTLCLDKDNNVYTAGMFMDSCDFDPGAGLHEIAGNTYANEAYISKLTNTGNFEWAVHLPGFSQMPQAVAWSVNTDSAGSVYLAGYFRGTFDFDPGANTYYMTAVGDWNDFFLLKLKQYPTGLEKSENLHSLNLYPNPTSGNTILNFETVLHNATVTLNNLQGQTLYSKKYESVKNTEINLAGYDNGIYIIKVIHDNKMYTSKLVKY